MKTLQCQTYPILFGPANEALISILSKKEYSRKFVLVDENTEELCLPKIVAKDFEIIKIDAGEIHKNIDTCNFMWQSLIDKGADRKSILINLGGGVIGDMGGFCASTYMRGIDFIQIPTTLLSQVDASVGSKLGIDHQGYKNIIGVFNNPQAVIIDTSFLKTLPERQYKSGYAEMIKHALIQDKELFERMVDAKIQNFDDLVYKNVSIKKKIVEEDPREQGLRKILNYGHSVGHAIETALLGTKDELLHGEAIALGMIIENILAVQLDLLAHDASVIANTYIEEFYSNALPKNIHDPLAIINHMKKDKKNTAGAKMISLLDQIGNCTFDQICSDTQILMAIEYYNNSHE